MEKLFVNRKFLKDLLLGQIELTDSDSNKKFILRAQNSYPGQENI